MFGAVHVFAILNLAYAYKLQQTSKTIIIINIIIVYCCYEVAITSSNILNSCSTSSSVAIFASWKETNSVNRNNYISYHIDCRIDAAKLSYDVNTNAKVGCTYIFEHAGLWCAVINVALATKLQFYMYISLRSTSLT